MLNRNNSNMRKSLFFVSILLSVYNLHAQDNLMDVLAEDEPVENRKLFATFKSTYLINAQTNESVKAKTLDFRITHRFGDVAGSNGGAHSLYGFDNANNIRFSFDYGVTNRLQLGFGRSKSQELLDGSIKFKIWEQREKGLPLSIGAYANVALTPQKDLNNKYTAFSDRLSYSYQLIFTSKVNERFSVGLLPTYLHRNLVQAGVNSANGAAETNGMFALAAMGRLKVTHSLAVIAEYFQVFSNYRIKNSVNPYYMPLGVGVEIETGGHVFQINLTNTAGIINNDFLVNSGDSWLKGQYKLGFTISRVFGNVR
jgi:hypothetical protein